MAALAKLPAHDAAWFEFVRSRPEATPFHHPAWLATLADAYGSDCFVLVLREAGEIVAGLPIVAKRSLPSPRRRWFSLPYTDSCAPLGDEDDVRDLLIAAEPARGSSAASLEIRAAPPAGAPIHPVARGYSHVLELGGFASAAELFASLSASRIRRPVKRALAAGVSVRVSESQRDLTEVFYRLHLLTRRRQGVPIQPRHFFECVWERMIASGLASTYVAELDGAPLAAALFLRWNGTAVYKFGASDPDRLETRPNHALFHAAIEGCFEAGDTRLDFGRTDAEAEGLREFKSFWGAMERPLVYGLSSVPRSKKGLGGGLARGVIRASPSWLCRFAGERLYRYVT